MRLLRRHETLLFLSLKVELGLYDLKFSLIFVKEIILQRKKIFSLKFHNEPEQMEKLV